MLTSKHPRKISLQISALEGGVRNTRPAPVPMLFVSYSVCSLAFNGGTWRTITDNGGFGGLLPASTSAKVTAHLRLQDIGSEQHRRQLQHDTTGVCHIPLENTTYFTERSSLNRRAKSHHAPWTLFMLLEPDESSDKS